MDPLHILLVLLVIAGIWAVIELALTIRRARTTVDSLDKTMGEVNDMLAETRPVVAKLDGAIDELQPALTQVEPLLKSANVAVDALTSNLIEVEAVVRDVSAVTGAAANAGNAVSGVADSASEAVQKLLGKFKPGSPDPERALNEGADSSREAVLTSAPEDAPAEAPAPAPRYYTYDSEPSSAAPSEAETAAADSVPSNQGDSTND
ncbi:MAG TPA: hypothetical protein K8W21_08950 [Enorma massiliensis]|uniref:hypothetical protein n=1 Tax=Enorma massiliensis TaxID=1472761 RepID=UPI0003395038|nr:hypothetical protein [Enorma massiliensis]CDD42889.1 putative uncharacterized protein [Collinsella sp. CAG:398]HJG63087.1 hypothetical protein [Enorma massiliensis]